jgi:galactose oxidase
VLAALLLLLPACADAVALPREGWVVSATSSENVKEQHPATYAIDANATTFWQSKWSSPADPLPHSYTISFNGGVNEVDGLVCTPRQDGNRNGNIGGYEVPRASCATRAVSCTGM